MAVAFDNAVGAGSDNAASTLSAAFTVAAGATYLKVGVSIAAGLTVTSVTCGTLGTETALTFRSSVEGTMRAEYWDLVSPPTGSIKVKVNIIAAGDHSFLAASYTGVNTTTPRGAFVTTFADAATSISVTVVSATGELVVDVEAGNTNGWVASVGAGETWELPQNTSNPAATRYSNTADKAGAASVVMTYNGNATAGNRSLIAVSLKPTGGPTTFPQSLADTLNLSEAITQRTNRAMAESVSLSETLSPQTRRLLAESIGLTESAARQIGKAAAETLSLSENLTAVKVVLLSLADTLMTSEGLTRLIQKTSQLTESIALSDTVARLTLRTVAETVSLTDIERQQAQKVLAESVALAETLIETVVKHHQESEGLTLSETAVRQIGKAIQDTLGLTETRFVQAAKTVTETVLLTEVLTTLFLPSISARFVRIVSPAATRPGIVAPAAQLPRIVAAAARIPGVANPVAAIGG